MSFDNYIFDLYGTLIDIHTDEEDASLWKAMSRYLDREFSARYTPGALRKRYLAICKEEESSLGDRLGVEYPEIRISWVWERLIQEKSNNRFDGILEDGIKFGPAEHITAEMQALCTFFREASRDKMIKYQGVDDVLKTLKSEGKKIFLLSNAQHAFTVKELEDCGLTGYFDDIFISSDLMMKKPQPEFMESLIKKHGLNRDSCVMIGNDILSDVGVAGKSGVKSIFLNTYSCTDKLTGELLESLEIGDESLLPAIVKDGDIRKILQY